MLPKFPAAPTLTHCHKGEQETLKLPWNSLALWTQSWATTQEGQGRARPGSTVTAVASPTSHANARAFLSPHNPFPQAKSGTRTRGPLLPL